jgi:hypothetical protein
MEFIKFDGGQVSLIQDNVLLIEYETVKSITVRNLFELEKIRKKLIGNNHYHTITDARNGLINISTDAKRYIAENKEASNKRLSDAILVDSFAKKIEAEIYVRLHKPIVKTKTFTDLNKALRWLASYELV